MQSSTLPDDVRDIAGGLCPEPVASVSELRKGNNSRIFRVDARGGRYALKKYPATDNRNRLEAEVRAVRFFERKGVARTPRVVAVAPERRYALFTWIDGDPVDTVTDADVGEFAAFQIALDGAIDARAQAEIGEASEACLSGQRILSQIERRYARLAAVKHDVAEFAAFFDDVLVPSLREFEAAGRAAYRRLGLDFAEEIAPHFRTLIPSDLGAHNALRGRDGRLFFLDFEYFGWDDPLTSIANFVMHPGMRLSEPQKQAYQQRLLGHFRKHGEAQRLPALMPLYALRWCAIILGELLPERWQHRMQSNPDMGDWNAVRRLQIDKARTLLSRIRP
jgi:aminoglycoside phosphotransferase (APT) family kinase protein